MTEHRSKQVALAALRHRPATAYRVVYDQVQRLMSQPYVKGQPSIAQSVRKVMDREGFVTLDLDEAVNVAIRREMMVRALQGYETFQG